VPSLLYISNVPQKAKEVLVDPVLFFIDKNKVLVPPHAHGSFAGAGKVAATNSKSLDVQELAGGKVCAKLDEKKSIPIIKPLIK
jgi:hypothetical protein